MSVIAVFIALGGAAWAVTKAPKNSVVSSSIRNGQVTKKDLGKDAVTGAKVKESTLGQVPSAASAATAARADSAASADSAAVAEVATASAIRLDQKDMAAVDPFITESGKPARLLATVGGAEVRVACFIDAGNPEILLSITSSVPASVDVTTSQESTGDRFVDASEQYHGALGAGNSIAINDAFRSAAGTTWTNSTAIYRSDGQTFSVTSHVDTSKPSNSCNLYGLVTRGR